MFQIMNSREEIIGKNQEMCLKNRERLTLSGVLEVLAFSEKELLADTNMGAVLIKGDNLKISEMSDETGELKATGRIDTIEYRKRKEKRGFLESVLR